MSRADDGSRKQNHTAVCPKVSVIVPVYNVEAYLERCLQTLVTQTLREIECLVVNDGSPDDSQKIIDRFAQQYPDMIKPFCKKNGGLSDARNFGLKHAKGEYIAFVDSDDYIDMDMLEQMYDRAKQTDADIVCCGISYRHPKKVCKRFYNPTVFGKPILESPEALLPANSFAWNKIYRRTFWEKHDFAYPVGQLFEDSALTYNILLLANKVEYVDLPLYHYIIQQREDAITQVVDERIFDIFQSCTSMITFYQRHHAFEQTQEQLVQICMRHIFARYKLFFHAKNRALALRYIDQSFLFLNTYFPGWKISRTLRVGSQKSLKKKIYAMIMPSKLLTRIYVLLPAFLRQFLLKCYRGYNIVRRKKWRLFRSKQYTLNKQATRKRFYVQKNGYIVMAMIQEILQQVGIQCFADFGTMLGLVRTGKLLEHDQDVDMGVLAQPHERELVRVMLERRGFKLWRRYIHQDEVVQESYRFKEVKVDMAYYETNQNASKTWLFYQRPGQTYPDNTRSVVELTYSPIQELTAIEVQDTTIMIPANAEQLLQEKYGENWRIPDKNWIYWESPAAQKLDSMGRFITYQYASHGRRVFPPYVMQQSEQSEQSDDMQGAQQDDALQASAE